MCGIVGYIGKNDVLPVLISGLQKLEYRGYDSAGVAFLESEELKVIKKKGRLDILSETLSEQGYLSPENEALKSGLHIGVGHTRWATHGAPSDENSHPHISANGKICVVHNGIIENYIELRNHLTEKGYTFVSQTDTEVLAHLIEENYMTALNGLADEETAQKTLFSAVQKTLLELEGAYALSVLCIDCPDMIIAARKDSPMVIGIGEDGNYIASDIPALLRYTRDVVIVEGHELVVLTKDSAQLYTIYGEKIKRKSIHVDWDEAAAEKGGYEHFMMKEIHEEPEAVRATVSPHIRHEKIELEDFPLSKEKIEAAGSIHIVACGTAYHAGYVGKYVIEKLCRIPVQIDVASEFRYRNPILNEKSIVIVISQSGETLDTMQAVREAKARGAFVLAIVNVIGSSMTREVDYVLYTAAGPEIAVASTKAYNTQLAGIYLLAFEMSHVLGKIDEKQYKYYQEQLLQLPEKLQSALQSQLNIQRFASAHFNAESIFFIGRGLDYAISMEASLKLKEISYIHSEAYPGGELKHGTIALIEKGTLVVCPMTQDDLMDKMISNIEEVKSRGATVLGITYKGNEQASTVCDEVIYIPDVDSLLAPVLAVTPSQLFAYYMAVNKGCDVDRPRNLAKSVTVE